MATSRNRLQLTMEALAKKRQKKSEEISKWSNQIQYYKNWDRHNSLYENWTSSQYYNSSLNQYDAMKTSEKKQESLEKRRNDLRKLFFEEEQNYELELQNSPRNHPKSHLKLNETPIEVLKDVNVGLKIAEEDRRRHETELKLYQQWKNENPILRNYEINQNKSDLKLAWLDQQIEKRMQQEKNEEEMRKMIAERDKLIQEEEQLEKLELEERNKIEKELISDIELQMKQFKIKDDKAEKLKREEAKAMAKKYEIEELVQRNLENMKRRKNEEIFLYNLKQSKLKLRKKVTEVEEQLKKEQNMIEEILASKTAEEIENEEKRNETKKSILSFLNYIQEQRTLEEQRKKYICSIFDSEAKQMWERQEKQWKEEQDARDKLLTEVLKEIQTQIEEKLTNNLQKQKLLLKEREEMLKKIEDRDRQMKTYMEELNQKKIERKNELDKQIKEKRMLELNENFKEEQKRKEELDNIRKEEEKLKQELMKMQTRRYPQKTFNRRIIW